jgi:hypothetical protein
MQIADKSGSAHSAAHGVAVTIPDSTEREFHFMAPFVMVPVSP